MRSCRERLVIRTPAWRRAYAALRPYIMEPKGRTNSTLDQLNRAVNARDAVDDIINALIVHAIEKDRLSFTQVGDAMGIARQNARKRYLSVTE